MKKTETSSDVLSVDTICEQKQYECKLPADLEALKLRNDI